MHPALAFTAHRPWPLPLKWWTWRQSWLDLAFIHYRIAPEKLRPLLPARLRLQKFDGSAWVGLVPFRMARVGPRLLPEFAVLPDFPELNLRTYVEFDGKPGVWFFSLDADCRPAVFGGRHLYALPYFSADMRQERHGDGFRFSSMRRADGIRFAGDYRPHGAIHFAQPGTFEHWATERYCLYAHSPRSGLTRVDVHHAPWPLQAAAVEIAACGILSAAGISPDDDPPRCHFSPGVDVVSFDKERLG